MFGEQYFIVIILNDDNNMRCFLFIFTSKTFAYSALSIFIYHINANMFNI